MRNLLLFIAAFLIRLFLYSLSVCFIYPF